MAKGRENNGDGDKALNFVVSFHEAGRQVCAALESFVPDFWRDIIADEHIAEALSRGTKLTEHAREQLLMHVQSQVLKYKAQDIYRSRRYGANGYTALLKLLQRDGIDPIEQKLDGEESIRTKPRTKSGFTRRYNVLVREEFEKDQINPEINPQEITQYILHRRAMVQFTEAVIGTLARQTTLAIDNPRRATVAQAAGYMAYLSVLAR